MPWDAFEVFLNLAWHGKTLGTSFRKICVYDLKLIMLEKLVNPIKSNHPRRGRGWIGWLFLFTNLDYVNARDNDMQFI